MTDELRTALADSAGRVPASTAPVAAILRTGRARRARRRGGLAAGACLVAAAVAVPLTGATSPQGTKVSIEAAGLTLPAAVVHHPAQTTVLGKNAAGGRTWWVLARSYPSAPHGCGVDRSGTPTGPDTTPSRTATAQGTKAPRYYVVLTGASTDGSSISDIFSCSANPVGWNVGPGAYSDTAVSGAPNAPRAFVGEPAGSVAGATMTLKNGTKLDASVVHLPGSGAGYYAFVVPNGQEKSLDEYDAQHHLVSHQNL